MHLSGEYDLKGLAYRLLARKTDNSMKGLFVVFHGFSAHSGISKKIFAQCDALRRNGADIELCHIEIAPDGTQRRMVGGQAIRTFGKGLRAKLEKGSR